jgi:glycosyltransferase involved in cell wall biosynthesis
MGKSYVIITPAKNEEKHLPLLAESMVKQTIKPSAWFIIDDGSDDRTPGIILELESKFPWIHSKRLEKSEVSNTNELAMHFVKMVKEAFDYAVDFCSRSGIEYDYIGKIDADMILPSDYFEKLIEKFEQNSRLGIAGGHYIFVKFDEKGDMTRKRTPKALLEDGPSGGCLLIGKDCYQDMGGLPLSPGQDSGALAKARLAGWETKRFTDIESFHLRRRGSAKWDGYIAYCSDYHPLLVLLNSLACTIRKEPLRGIAYLYGYSLL